MNKATAIQLLGGTVTSAAKAVGVTSSAISNWPEELSQRIADRVHAAIARSKDKPTVSARRRKAEGAAS